LNNTGIQISRVIVHVHREQARSYSIKGGQFGVTGNKKGLLLSGAGLFLFVSQ
jgi:hypothetical protein